MDIAASVAFAGMIARMAKALPRFMGMILLGVLPTLHTVVGQDSLRVQVDRALDKARPVLEAQAKQAQQGQLALVCLAMAHHGFTLDDKVFAESIARLARSKLDQTYELSLRLMVMAQVREYPARLQAAKADSTELLLHQADGGFTYHRAGDAKKWDLSNTQYAALGLRAAVSLGVKIPSRRWVALARGTLGMRQYRSGFGYRPGGKDPTPSMTVAGIAVLQICYQHLNHISKTRQRIPGALRQAWEYVDKNRRTIGAGPDSMRNFYYHYGIERAAILSDKEKIGEVDWYAAGARMLLKHQIPGGSWGLQVSGRPRSKGPVKGDVINTSFAVLFLRRRFQKTLTGPTTPDGALTRDLPAQSGDAAVAATVAREVARGYHAVPDLILAMRSPILVRRKVVAKALPRITGRFLSYSPYRSLKESEAVIREAEAWWLREGRKKLR